MLSETEFKLDDFEVVEREYFSRNNLPTLTLEYGKLIFNSAFIREFGKVAFIQILLETEKKKLLIIPCEKASKDNFRWRKTKNEALSGRIIFCTRLTTGLFSKFGWNILCNYKSVGREKQVDNKRLFVFDLDAVEAFEPKNDEEVRTKILLICAETKFRLGCEAMKFSCMKNYAAQVAQGLDY